MVGADLVVRTQWVKDDLCLDSDIVTRVCITHGCAMGIFCCGLSRVTVLSQGGNTRSLIGPRLRCVELVVAVRISALEDRCDALVVGHGDVCQWDIAGVGDDVLPRHRLSDRDDRSSGRVGVFAVGRFLDVDRWGGAGRAGCYLGTDFLSCLDCRLHGPLGPIAVQGEGKRHRRSDFHTTVELQTGDTGRRVVAEHDGAGAGSRVVDIAVFDARG